MTAIAIAVAVADETNNGEDIAMLQSRTDIPNK